MTEAKVDPKLALLLLALSENNVLGIGPNGEQPSPPTAVELTYDERQTIKAMNATAAIVMHYGDNYWSRAQIDGLRTEFAKMGVRVVATTDAGFKSDKQIADLGEVLSAHPDVIVSIPTDAAATAPAYLRAAARGVKLVFMDNVPEGMRAGRDYVSLVSADNVGNGVVSAHLMAQALEGRGDVGIVFHGADFFVTRQRYEAFKKTITEDYPDIRIPVESGFVGPDFVADGRRLASAMLAAHPGLDGIWTAWDVPAEGVIAAARETGRNDLYVTTVDLGLNVAVEMASGGLVYGVAAQRPFDQGVNEALLAGYGLLGKAAPPYVALPHLPVTRDRVLGAWEEVYRTPAPAALVDAAG